MFDFFKQVAFFHLIQYTLVAQDWNLFSVSGSHFALILFTFLYVDIIDFTAIFYFIARFFSVVNPETGDFFCLTIAYCTNTAIISINLFFGCLPVIVFIESGAGIMEGGRTGFIVMTTGIYFLISIFFAPIFMSIPL